MTLLTVGWALCCAVLIPVRTVLCLWPWGEFADNIHTPLARSSPNASSALWVNRGSSTYRTSVSELPAGMGMCLALKGEGSPCFSVPFTYLGELWFPWGGCYWDVSFSIPRTVTSLEKECCLSVCSLYVEWDAVGILQIFLCGVCELKDLAQWGDRTRKLLTPPWRRWLLLSELHMHLLKSVWVNVTSQLCSNIPNNPCTTKLLFSSM